MTAMNAVFKITAAVNGQQAVKELAKNINEASTAGDKMKRSFLTGANALKALVLSAGAAAFGAFIKSSIDLADNLNDISQRTGVAVEQLARYKVAAENSGTSVEALAGSLNKLNKNLVDARDGTGPSAEAFKAMGISIEDANGNLKSADQITAEVADRFAAFPDGPQKAALAMAIFGKSGADLIPMLNMGSEAINQFSVNIDQDFATASDNFNDRLGYMRGSITTFGVEIAKTLLPALTDAADSFGELFQDGARYAKYFGVVISDVFRGIMIAAAFLVKGLKDIVATIRMLGNAAKGITDGDFTGDGARARFLYDLQNNRDEFEIFAAQQRLNSFSFGDGGVEQATKRKERAQREAEARGAVISPSVRASMEGFNPSAGAEKTSKAKKSADDYERAKEAALDYIEAQRQAIDNMRMEAEYIGKTSIEIEKLKDAREFDLNVMEVAKDLKGQDLVVFRQQTDAIREQRQALLELNYQQSRTFETGARNYLAKYVEETRDAAAQTEKVLSGAFKGAEDALTEFVTTGKMNFRDLANSIIKDLTRIVIQRSITGPIADALGGMFGGKSGAGGGSFFNSVKSFFGFANGGIMTGGGPLPLRTYATGGIASSPQLAMFGEGSMPEAYVPLPDGRRIPVALSGGGAGNINVVVNMNGNDQATADSKQGQDVGRLIASTVKSILINEKRPGGLLAAV